MKHDTVNGVRTWIEVDRQAVAHNFRVFRTHIPKRTKLMAVVKSNAYGHDIFQFSREMERLGADMLGVDSMVEARSLRREGIVLPILVLGYTLPELFAEAAENNIALTLSNFEAFEALGKAKLRQPVAVHIKVDTGMHRQGFLRGDLSKILRYIDISKCRVEGLYTHFANAKNPAFPADTRAQIAEFEQWIVAFRKAGYKPMVHASATAGALLFPESHYDMARIGIGLYGLWPAKETEAALSHRIILKPALAWKSLVSEIKQAKKGARIGYDYAETLVRDTMLAIVPVGYWHGYPRALSSIGRVLVGGKECKVIGRVSMDMLTIDITDVKGARVGDEVVLAGQDQTNSASLTGIASLTDSSWYEIATRLNPLIKRVYV